MKAFVTVDSFPGRQFEGWVGFISPVAEFTPKTVETEELRTSLRLRGARVRERSEQRPAARACRPRCVCRWSAGVTHRTPQTQ